MSPLRPTAEIATRALLPGDPGRALALAQALLDRPLMANHHRGLWGYTGTAADGDPMTVQSTGLGGPSAAAVVAALGRAGVRRALRVGTCRGGPWAPGTVVAAARVRGEDGTSRALGAQGEAEVDPEVLAVLTGAGLPGAQVLTTDLGGPGEDGWCHDRTTAGLLAACRAASIRAGAVLVVIGDGLDDDALAIGAERAARAALLAL